MFISKLKLINWKNFKQTDGIFNDTPITTTTKVFSKDTLHLKFFIGK